MDKIIKECDALEHPEEPHSYLPEWSNTSTPLLERLASLTASEKYDTTYLTHGIHPYAAKYIPQIPNLIIREHTAERNAVLDPFCGSGTTLLEAALLGRKSIGIDLNPVAALISLAKTTPLDITEINFLREFANGLSWGRESKKLLQGYEDPLDHWFERQVFMELSYIRNTINEHITIPRVRNLALCNLSAIVVQVSRQESETRYAAKEKSTSVGCTIKKFCTRMQRVLDRLQDLSNFIVGTRNIPQIIQKDLRFITEEDLPADTVDLIVTSPPYPNSYDYYLYHKWRMWWLGYDVKLVQKAEIGSRNEHSSRKAPIESYRDKMIAALRPAINSLKSSKLAYILVGDAVIDGKLINIANVYSEIADQLPLRLVDHIGYNQGKVSRSFREKTSAGCHGGARSIEKLQRVLVFEKVAAKSLPRAVFNGAIRTEAYASAKLRLVTLDEKIESGAKVALKSQDIGRHIHSLGRYPSKFIPEIPAWAIKNYSKPGDIVLDPFMGSATTLVEAAIAGRNSVGLDVSPYSVLLAKAKTTIVEPTILLESARQFSEFLLASKRIPKVERPHFDLEDFWFNERHLNELAYLLNFVRTNFSADLVPFYEAVISTVIRPCSYQDESQVKVKRDPKKVVKGTSSPIELIKVNFDKQIARLLGFRRLETHNVTTVPLLQSASTLKSFASPDTVDLVITSPPYINAMNYAMTHRSESFVLGLLNDQSKLAHDREYFGSERVYVKEYSDLAIYNNEFGRKIELNDVLARIFELEPKRSFIAYRFFSLMWEALEGCAYALKEGGHCVLVVGRNTIKGQKVDTFGILVSMCEAMGMSLIKTFEYEIIKNAFKLTRHSTADIIALDGVAVLQKNKN